MAVVPGHRGFLAGDGFDPVFPVVQGGQRQGDAVQGEVTGGLVAHRILFPVYAHFRRCQVAEADDDGVLFHGDGQGLAV